MEWGQLAGKEKRKVRGKSGQMKRSTYVMITDVKRAFETSKVFLSQRSAQTMGIHSVLRKANAEFVLEKAHLGNRNKTLSVSLFSGSQVGYSIEDNN